MREIVMCAAAAWALLVAGGAPARADEAGQKIGRPVRVLMIGPHQPKPLAEIADIVDRQAAKGADIVVLPETFMGQREGTEETLDGPAVTAMAALAKKHHTYIVCPIDRKQGARRFNSAVLLDREGKVAFIYNKLYPIEEEYDAKHVQVGRDTPVYEADFGRIGFAICFDANFPEVWQRLADLGAELVLFPSAFFPGAKVQAHALNYSYYVVTVTSGGYALVHDITGDEMLYDHNQDTAISRITLDLDRALFHTDFNIPKRDKLLKEHAADVAMDPAPRRRGESWYFVLQAKRPGVSARELARQYGMEEFQEYIRRSRRDIDARRESPFVKTVAAGAPPEKEP